MNQQKFLFKDNHGTIKIVQVDNESSDEILKARYPDTIAKEVKAFCVGRNITVTDFLREYSRLGSVYFDHIETLIEKENVLIPLLESLTKK